MRAERTVTEISGNVVALSSEEQLTEKPTNGKHNRNSTGRKNQSSSTRRKSQLLKTKVTELCTCTNAGVRRDEERLEKNAQHGKDVTPGLPGAPSKHTTHTSDETAKFRRSERDNQRTKQR